MRFVAACSGASRRDRPSRTCDGAIDVGRRCLAIAGDDGAGREGSMRIAHVAVVADLLAGDHERHVGGVVAAARLPVGR